MDEEVEHKDEIVQLTEEVLHARGQEQPMRNFD